MKKNWIYLNQSCEMIYLYKLNLHNACKLLSSTQALIIHDSYIQIRFGFPFPDLLHLETTSQVMIIQSMCFYLMIPTTNEGEVDGSGL